MLLVAEVVGRVAFGKLHAYVLAIEEGRLTSIEELVAFVSTQILNPVIHAGGEKFCANDLPPVLATLFVSCVVPNVVAKAAIVLPLVAFRNDCVIISKTLTQRYHEFLALELGLSW